MGELCDDDSEQSMSQHVAVIWKSPQSHLPNPPHRPCPASWWKPWVGYQMAGRLRDICCIAAKWLPETCQSQRMRKSAACHLAPASSNSSMCRFVDSLEQCAEQELQVKAARGPHKPRSSTRPGCIIRIPHSIPPGPVHLPSHSGPPPLDAHLACRRLIVLLFRLVTLHCAA
ncbi:hypothetical protein K402DRAFT_26301 [Aulographum hederae CBS 113979]|uniref:Uncharacterized protein n=1 Tax=Aulographum hederae CBS 113979 TaxID=1176131 RepID=A0A6G1H5Q3_9PEZI|nr:hypothetical protein K402DRAFT_26301 [Aulographum hederae CBS 113979]